MFDGTAEPHNSAVPSGDRIGENLDGRRRRRDGRGRGGQCAGRRAW